MSFWRFCTSPCGSRYCWRHTQKIPIGFITVTMDCQRRALRRGQDSGQETVLKHRYSESTTARSKRGPHLTDGRNRTVYPYRREALNSCARATVPARYIALPESTASKGGGENSKRLHNDFVLNGKSASVPQGVSSGLTCTASPTQAKTT